MTNQKDIQFLQVAKVIAQRSKCSSRQVGAVIVKDGSVVSEGYNGSARGISLCQDRNETCRRQKMGFKSGEGLEHCPAVHAEANAIAQAARNGIPTKGCTLYCWCTVPCKNCVGLIINAGIKRVVCLDEPLYDQLGSDMLNEAGVQIDRVSKEDVDGVPRYFVGVDPAAPSGDRTVVLHSTWIGDVLYYQRVSCDALDRETVEKAIRKLRRQWRYWSCQ